MLDLSSEPNNIDERKLWFEYIKTLNERELQRAQRSGINTYVLLATLVALLYRFGPQLPQFINQPDNIVLGVTIFILLTINVCGVVMVTFAISMYCAGDTEFRAAPKSERTITSVVYALFALAGAGFICLECWVARSDIHLPRFGRYFLFAYAGWLVLNFVYPVVKFGQLAKKAKEIKNVLPRFTPFRTPPWTGLVFLPVGLIWLICGSILIVAYIRPLPDYGLRPIKAASISLIVIFIVGYMFLRSIGSVTRHKYFGLERDIVLNQMTPAEIRSKYLSEFTGPDMVQWLDDALAGLDAREDRLRRAQDSALDQSKEIAKINVEYRAERRERVQPIIKELAEAMGECLSHHTLLHTQMRLFITGYVTNEEAGALRVKFLDYDRRFKEFVKKRNERFLPLIEELTKLGDR